MDVLTVKIIAMVLVGSLSLLLGLLPIRVARMLGWRLGRPQPQRSCSSRVLSALLCFGGGVIFTTAFTHMLPEVREMVEADMEAGLLPHTHLSMAEIFMCCGFFLIYFIEEVVHLGVEKFWHISSPKDSAGHRRSLAHTGATEDSSHGQSELKSVPSVSDGTVNWAFDNDQEQGSLDPPPREAPTVGHGHELLAADPATFQATLRGLLAVLALSCHAIFEGMAVGLEEDSSGTWQLFFAISAHKYVIAFCVGMQCVTSGIRTPVVVIYLAVFSLVSPAGIAIGTAVTESVGGGWSTQAVLVTVLQGIATGTLVYVVFFEVLEQERARQDHGLLQFFSLLLGFGCMLLISGLAGHNHSHGSHGHSHGHDHGHGHGHEDHATTEQVTNSSPASLLGMQAAREVTAIL